MKKPRNKYRATKLEPNFRRLVILKRREDTWMSYMRWPDSWWHPRPSKVYPRQSTRQAERYRKWTLTKSS